MKYLFTILTVIAFHFLSVAQDKPVVKDSTAFIDSIMREMDSYLDSLSLSRSFFNVSIGAGTGFFNFKNSSTLTFNTEKKLIFSPSVSYYHKTGLGLSATGYIINEDSALNLYQFALSPSYDYIKAGKWSTGVAYTRYFTKEDLAFYTTPIQNEIYAYFNYKKWWIQPGIAAGFGWGSRTEYKEREVDIIRRWLQLDPRPVTVINKESISDYSLLLSVRHDFDWENVFNGKDLITLTPVLLLSGGTQKFGFNTSYQSRFRVLNNFLPSNQKISDKKDFDVQSTTLVIRCDYSVGKLYLQPQALFDYYLHSADQRFNTAYSIIAGINF